MSNQINERLKGGVIMDVTTPEQSRVPRRGRGCSRDGPGAVPADIRKQGGVVRMSDLKSSRQ